MQKDSETAGLINMGCLTLAPPLRQAPREMQLRGRLGVARSPGPPHSRHPRRCLPARDPARALGAADALFGARAAACPAQSPSRPLGKICEFT